MTNNFPRFSGGDDKPGCKERLMTDAAWDRQNHPAPLDRTCCSYCTRALHCADHCGKALGDPVRKNLEEP